jgi:hypothetical protein
MQDTKEVPLMDDEWVLIEPGYSFSINSLEGTDEFTRLKSASDTSKHMLRVAGIVNGFVDGVISGSMLASTLSWVVVPLAASASLSLPPLAVFALATSGVIAAYNVISTAGNLRVQELEKNATLKGLQAKGGEMSEETNKEMIVYINNALTQNNSELIVKIIQYTRQLKKLKDPIDADLLDSILETLAKAVNFTGDERHHRKLFKAVFSYLVAKDEKKSEYYSILIKGFYQELSGYERVLGDVSTKKTESYNGGVMVGFFSSVKAAAPRLQSAQSNAMAVSPNLVFSAPVLVSTGAGFVLGEQAKKHEQSYEEAKIEIENKVALINILTRIIQEKNELVTVPAPDRAIAEEKNGDSLSMCL